MKILIFDTETTGLPIGRNPSVISTHNWPYMVQLSCILYDTQNNMLIEYINEIIKIPDGINISRDSQKLHGISKELTKSKGIDIKIILNRFNKLLNQADTIIGHNLLFDKNIIMVESLRNKVIQDFKKNKYCTMKNAIQLCNITAYNTDNSPYLKYPKLWELNNKLFNYIPNGLHNSMVDVLICLRCYGKMVFDKDYCQESKQIANLFNEFEILETYEDRAVKNLKRKR